MSKEIINKKSISLAFEKIARQRGHSSEYLTGIALKNLTKSVYWIVGFRKATKDEDKKRGIDFVIETTNTGMIFLQVKSSKTGKENSLKKHPKIPVIVINKEENLKRIQKRIRKVISSQRDYYLRKKLKLGKEN